MPAQPPWKHALRLRREPRRNRAYGTSQRAWLERWAMPHSDRLHTIERVMRQDMNTLKYDVTIDDPGAYTAPWTSGYTLGWQKGLALFEYVCQENNISPESMGGDALTSRIVP